MKYTKIDPQNPDPKRIAEAVQVLRGGGIIVYPTDTIYGLGVDVMNPKAVDKLYLIKQRDMSRPVSLMVSDLAEIEDLLGILPQKRIAELNKLLPGKVTVLLENTLKKTIPVFRFFQENAIPLTKIGFRIPDYPLCTALSRELGHPISTTSANISGKKAGSTVKEIVADFGDKLDMILDAGELPASKASTVIDFTKSPHLVFREGEVKLSKLRDILPDVSFNKRREHFVITFVCSGNICRSPMAEAIMKKKINRTRYKNIVRVQSAGTLELSPTRAHYLAMIVSEENDISLEKHKSKYITDRIVEESDIVFCMAINHYDYLREHFPQKKQK
jgi:L-threonylcarbamoyladenylate synthase